MPAEYKYSPFRNIGPQQPYDSLSRNDKNSEDCRKRYENQIYVTNQGYKIKIIDYMDARNVLVQFVHDGFIKNAFMSAIKRGAVDYPFHKNKYGAYFGIGPYNTVQYKYVHSAWGKMFERCFGENYKVNKYRMYNYVTISQDWYNFQIFADWYIHYRNQLNPDPSLNYQIDKDILQQGIINKVYSSSTCCIVPRPINSAFECMNVIRSEQYQNLPKGVDLHIQAKGKMKYTARCSYGEGQNGVYLGIFNTPEEAFLVYKKEKERYIHGLADKYFSINAITKQVYDALYSIDIKPFGE